MLESDLTQTKVELPTSLDDIVSSLTQNETQVLPLHTFQSLGRAFCPVTESIKHPTVTSSTEGEIVLPLGEASFKIPGFVQHMLDRETLYNFFNFHSKEEYEQSKRAQYKLDAQLIVDASLAGRWSSKSKEKSDKETISILLEKKIVSLFIENPEKYMNQDFITNVNSLPEIYDPNNCSAFEEFFSTYGSHLIINESLGGWIKFEGQINKTLISAEKSANIETKAKGILAKVTGNLAVKYMDMTKEWSDVGVTNVTIGVGGGKDPPLLTSLADIDVMKLQDWLESIDKYPTSLKHTRCLYPYYNLNTLSKNSRFALRQATFDYLGNTRNKKLTKSRNQAASEGQAAAGSMGAYVGYATFISGILGYAVYIELARTGNVPFSTCSTPRIGGGGVDDLEALLKALGTVSSKVGMNVFRQLLVWALHGVTKNL